MANRRNYLFTSESVSEGHPDKVCDRISDAVVDLYMAADPHSRVAIETLVTTNRIVMAGEVRGPESVTAALIEEAARRAVREIGYEQKGFHWRDAEFEYYVHEQSADIARGVDADAEGGKDEGAGDQGIMFGYACRETEPLMPAPIFYAHRILHEMAKARHTGVTPELGPDAKSQVTLVYEDGKPVRAHSVVVSTQHGEDVSQERVQEIVRGFVDEVMPKGWVNGHTKFHINPTGRFVIGGPDGDTGARSSSIRMAARPRMAAARSPARIRPRSTALRPMQRAISPRTLWRPGSPTAAPCNSPTPSVCRSRFRSMSICTARAASMRGRSGRLSGR